MSVKAKMTAINDEIRTLSGTTGVMGLDAMAANVRDANNEVVGQADLIAQIKAALENKMNGGAGDEIPWLTREITEYSNSTLTKLGAYALSGTSVTSLNLPALTTIEGYAFYQCAKLTEVNFPLLTEIPNNGFREFTGLVKADLPMVKAIKSNAFYKCTNLETLILRSNTLCTLVAGTTFTGTPIASGTGYIYVHKTLADGSDGVATYQAQTNWSAFQFRAIEDYPEICG